MSCVGPLKVKKIHKNLKEPENVNACKGEALILANRIQVCEAATTLLDVEAGAGTPKSQEEIVAAVLVLKQHWHHMSSSLKAMLCERRLIVEIQSLSTCASDEVEELARSVADTILPMSVMGFAGAAFDGAKPTVHAVFSEIYHTISQDFDVEEMDPDEATAAKQTPFLLALKAVELGGFLAWNIAHDTSYSMHGVTSCLFRFQ